MVFISTVAFTGAPNSIVNPVFDSIIPAPTHVKNNEQASDIPSLKLYQICHSDQPQLYLQRVFDLMIPGSDCFQNIDSAYLCSSR